MSASKLFLFGAAAVMAGALLFTPDAANAVDAKAVSEIAEGGRIYDNWVKELGERKPKKAHPLYPADGPFADDPEHTWRCVACHGWDYRGADGAFSSGPWFTGIKGISEKAGWPVEKVLALVGNGKHGYADVLDEESLEKVATFVSLGQVRPEDYIDPVTYLAKTQTVEAGAFFSAICSNCHGADGRMMETIPPLGEIARTRPAEAYHKMLNGHAGGDMPALRAFPPRTVIGMLAYIQNMPDIDLLASISRGGKLYDDWGREVRYKYPDTPHPAFPKDGKVSEGSNSYRCTECHGWDYKGANGIRGIRNLAGALPKAIMNILADDTHQLDDVLKYRDLRDLANFISRGQVEVNEFIDANTRKARGDAQANEAYYLTLCASCHGDTGIDIRTMPAMGRVAVDTPWKALHKMFHGHPGDEMPAWQAPLPPSVAKNLLAKMQTLPVNKRR